MIRAPILVIGSARFLFSWTRAVTPANDIAVRFAAGVNDNRPPLGAA